MHIWVKNFRAELHCMHTCIKLDRLTLCRYDEAVARSPEGATNGYCSGTRISSLKAPLSNGEWGGPCQMDKTEGRYIGSAGHVCQWGFECEGEMGEDGHWHRGQAVANARPAFPYLQQRLPVIQIAVITPQRNVLGHCSCFQLLQ